MTAIQFFRRDASILFHLKADGAIGAFMRHRPLRYRWLGDWTVEIPIADVGPLAFHFKVEGFPIEEVTSRSGGNVYGNDREEDEYPSAAIGHNG